ncbi:MAG TPA: 6-carboxytetrahydropterin synthase [Terriglobales bacterium]|nr:6-carboxytetrahydropterin synthase [Terriglobales bacterium]
MLSVSLFPIAEALGYAGMPFWGCRFEAFWRFHWLLTPDYRLLVFMVYLTRKAEFSASHYYHNPDFTPEENVRIFGKCNNPHGHGHNYTLEVTVKGAVDPKSGFVVDLKQLKEVMNREVLDAMDHRFLNKEVPEFANRIPTTENIAIAIWHRLAPKLKTAQLHRVRVYETPDLFVDFYGEA